MPITPQQNANNTAASCQHVINTSSTCQQHASNLSTRQQHANNTTTTRQQHATNMSTHHQHAINTPTTCHQHIRCEFVYARALVDYWSESLGRLLVGGADSDISVHSSAPLRIIWKMCDFLCMCERPMTEVKQGRFLYNYCDSTLIPEHR